MHRRPSGISDAGGTLVLSSSGAGDVLVVLRVEIVAPVDPGPQAEPRSALVSADLVLFPNPADNTLYIRHLSSRARRATVYTLGGRSVLQAVLAGSRSAGFLRC